MSGGEDSRLLACIMKKYGKFDGYIILEKHNREYDLALKSSQKIGFDLSLISMSDNFYFDILNQAINITGNSNQYFHMFSLQKKLVDKLIFDGKLKVNPITLDARTFYKKPSAFDL